MDEGPDDPAAVRILDALFPRDQGAGQSHGMTKDQYDHMPARQFRVTLTEDLRYNALTAALFWRTFPCRADQWATPHWFTFPLAEVRPITSQETLRGYLGTLAEQPWQEGRYPRR